MSREPDYKADNDWLRNEMATNMIYKKEADELRADNERLRHALRVMIGEAGEGMSYSERCAMVRAELETKP